MSAQEDLSRLPVLLQHMTLAIFDRLKGTEKERFVAALNIARSRLAEYHYATSASRAGPLARFQLTGAGQRQSAKHPKDARKAQRFRRLFETYYVDLPYSPDDA